MCTGGQAGPWTRHPEVTRGQGPGTSGLLSLPLGSRAPTVGHCHPWRDTKTTGRSNATYVLEAPHKALSLWTYCKDRRQRRKEEIWSGCDVLRTQTLFRVTTQHTQLGGAPSTPSGAGAGESQASGCSCTHSHMHAHTHTPRVHTQAHAHTPLASIPEIGSGKNQSWEGWVAQPALRRGKALLAG